MKKVILIFLIISLTLSYGCTNNKFKINSPTTCFTTYKCTEWSGCLNGTQTRSCVDENKCKEPNYNPVISQICNNTKIENKTVDLTNIPKTNSIKQGDNYIEKGKTLTYKTKTITLEKISDNAVMINITGNMEILRINQPRTLEGINFNLIATFDDFATINIS